MALTIPLALRLEANKLVGTRPWLLFLKITLPDTSELFLVRNTEDVVYASQTWIAFPFDLGERGESGDAKVPSVTLRISNVERALTPLIEANEGLVGSQVQLIVVHEANLGADYTALTMTYTIIATHLPDNTWIEFTLGAESPMRRRFPLYQAIPQHCSWVAQFKGAECKYAGADATCEGTLNDCRSKLNTPNFGGRPGMGGAPRFV